MNQPLLVDNRINKIGWSLLYHLLGLWEENGEALKELEDNPPNDTWKKLCAEILVLQSRLEKKGFRTEYYTPAEERDSYSKIARLCTVIINNHDTCLGVNLALEPKRNDNTSEASDDPAEGISRYPFKRITKVHESYIPLAVCLYILRAFALFFSRDTEDRDYNAALLSLNDLHQACLFSWRSYHNLDVNHYKSGRSLDSYYDEVLAHGENHDFSSKLLAPYFVWSSLLVTQVFRAFIHHSIYDDEKAAKFYSLASVRYKQLESHFKRTTENAQAEPDISLKRFIVTPTLIQSFYKYSKILFDQGNILRSLVHQLSCLKCVLYRSNDSEDANTEDRNTLIEDLKQKVRFITAELRLPIFDKDNIHYTFFKAPGCKNDEFIEFNEKYISEFINLVHDRYPPLVARLFVRIGYNLYTLKKRYVYRGTDPINKTIIKTRSKIQENVESTLKARFEPFFRAYSLYKHVEHELRPSSMGLYCLTLIGKPLPPETEAFINEIDKKTSMLIRNQLSEAREEPFCGLSNWSKHDFYLTVIKGLTQNIGNIITIPKRNNSVLMRRGYKHRWTKGDLSFDTVGKMLEGQAPNPDETEKTEEKKCPDRLMILKRWQSINPIIPQLGTNRLRGGGYFLTWNNKGIVIDPGFDFIQNFYDEGFSIEDIDAIIITHSHPDHDAELSDITALINELNEFNSKFGKPLKKIDVFLNDSTHWKYSSWLQATKVKLGKVFSLSSLCWDKGTDEFLEGPYRGENTLDLSKGDYAMKINVIPAWHDDVISKTASIGLKFELFRDQECAGIIGYTGDTGLYEVKKADGSKKSIEDYYADCDIIIANIGDVKVKELYSELFFATSDEECEKYLLPLVLLDLFEMLLEKNFNNIKLTIEELFEFCQKLDIFDDRLLEEIYDVDRGNSREKEELGNIISDYLESKYKKIDHFSENISDLIITKLSSISTEYDLNQDQENAINTVIKTRLKSLDERPSIESITAIDNLGLSALKFAIIQTARKWHYPYHLGVSGIYRLFKAMLDRILSEDTKKKKKDQNRTSAIFIIGEIPQEMASYRHQISCWLSRLKSNQKDKKTAADKYVYPFTGDIGLQIRLDIDKDDKRLAPKIKCIYCNYNNETRFKGETSLNKDEVFHDPEKIAETAVKSNNDAIIYLCTEKDHQVETLDEVNHFIYNPNNI